MAKLPFAIRLIITGGTIDGFENEESVISSSSVPRLLKEANITIPISTEELMLKDSRAVTDEDRERILEVCETSEEGAIVITHGTIAMIDTAGFLGQRIEDKVVVLTGAMVPFIQEKSDASFNIGYAIASAQHLSNGVYVAMNGRVFPWDDVQKNSDVGIFEGRSDESMLH